MYVTYALVYKDIAVLCKRWVSVEFTWWRDLCAVSVPPSVRSLWTSVFSPPDVAPLHLFLTPSALYSLALSAALSGVSAATAVVAAAASSAAAIAASIAANAAASDAGDADVAGAGAWRSQRCRRI